MVGVPEGDLAHFVTQRLHNSENEKVTGLCSARAYWTGPGRQVKAGGRSAE